MLIFDEATHIKQLLPWHMVDMASVLLDSVQSVNFNGARSLDRGCVRQVLMEA